MAKAPAKAQVGKMGAGGSSDAEPETGTPEPAVMAAGASEENVEKADAGAKASEPGAPQKNDAGAQAKALGDAEQEGFRDDAGRFTGNPPTDTERLDAICDLLTANGWSLPKVLHR
jgi:hypothetical protein